VLSSWQINRLKRVLGAFGIGLALILAYVGGYIADKASVFILISLLCFAAGLAYLGIRCSVG
jgi:hypothetical protein